MKHSIRAKKKLGQHFLNDDNIARNIAKAALDVSGAEPLLEIGPGTGILTQHFIERENFVALDVDLESVQLLKNNFPEHANKIVFQDFLHVELANLFSEKPIHLVGNFPYNISSQILFKALENRHLVQTLTGMFQKEVAERIAEKPGSKVYGILSVLTQAFYKTEYLFTVSEKVFIPPPKVKSAVIQLVRKPNVALGCDEKLFFKVVKTTFNQRRKTIRNSIKPLINDSIKLTDPLLEKRPEQLGVEEFIKLTLLVGDFVQAP